MIFAEKGLPVILRPFRGSLDVKWGCGVRSKSKNVKRKICLVPPPLIDMINLHERHQFRCFVVVLFKTQKFNTGFSVGKEVFDNAHKGPVITIAEG